MKQLIISLIIIGAGVAGAFSFGEKLHAMEKAEQTETTNTVETAKTAEELLKISADDVVYGQADAPITITEYASLSCSHCATFYKETLPLIDENYIQTGKVKLVLRNFPHNAPGFRGAMLMACVDKDQYYTFAKVLFSMQEKWAFSSGFLEDLKKIAQVGGVSAEAFDSCMANKDVENNILAQRKAAGELLKIEATPTFFINDEKLSGTVSFPVFKEKIDAALKAKDSK